jgi:hypothetical protein
MNAPRRLRPVREHAVPVVQPELLFCAVCQVSIARAELDRGDARVSPRGRVFCAVCAIATPEERVRRRAELENEFADDAPIGARRADDAQAEPPPLPAPPRVDVATLEARVGELERAAFRLQARVESLEERLEATRRRLP